MLIFMLKINPYCIYTTIDEMSHVSFHSNTSEILIQSIREMLQ